MQRKRQLGVDIEARSPYIKKLLGRIDTNAEELRTEGHFGGQREQEEKDRNRDGSSREEEIYRA